MLFWLAFIGIFCVLAFGFVVFFGPPYLPTLRKQKELALDMLELSEGDTLLELGSGDGRVMLAAAKRGYKVIGIELNPILVVISYFVTIKYRKQVRIILGSFWGAPWPRADAIFTFMLPRYMTRLDERIEKWHTKPTKLATFAFVIPDKEPVKKEQGVSIYEYK